MGFDFSKIIQIYIPDNNGRSISIQKITELNGDILWEKPQPPQPAYISISETNWPNISAAGATKTFTVTASGEWVVENPSQTWITVTKSGNNGLSVTVGQNSDTSTRNGSVTVKLTDDPSIKKTLSISQQAQSSASITLQYNTIYISTNSSMTMGVTSTGHWTAQCTNNDITITPNSEYTQATITVASTVTPGTDYLITFTVDGSSATATATIHCANLSIYGNTSITKSGAGALFGTLDCDGVWDTTKLNMTLTKSGGVAWSYSNPQVTKAGDNKNFDIKYQVASNTTDSQITGTCALSYGQTSGTTYYNVNASTTAIQSATSSIEILTGSPVTIPAAGGSEYFDFKYPDSVTNPNTYFNASFADVWSSLNSNIAFNRQSGDDYIYRCTFAIPQNSTPAELSDICTISVASEPLESDSIVFEQSALEQSIVLNPIDDIDFSGGEITTQFAYIYDVEQTAFTCAVTKDGSPWSEVTYSISKLDTCLYQLELVFPQNSSTNEISGQITVSLSSSPDISDSIDIKQLPTPSIRLDPIGWYPGTINGTHGEYNVNVTITAGYDYAVNVSEDWYQIVKNQDNTFTIVVDDNFTGEQRSINPGANPGIIAHIVGHNNITSNNLPITQNAITTEQAAPFCITTDAKNVVLYFVDHEKLQDPTYTNYQLISLNNLQYRRIGYRLVSGGEHESDYDSHWIDASPTDGINQISISGDHGQTGDGWVYKLYLRSKDDNDIFGNNRGNVTFRFTQRTIVDSHIDLSGNIMSLVNGNVMTNTITNDSQFKWLFDGIGEQGEQGITSMPELFATTLASHSYEGMFRGCTYISNIKQIHATTLAPYCCASMFEQCSRLGNISSTVMPTATTAPDHCYYRMFYESSVSGTSGNILPATTAGESCYQEMFSNCAKVFNATITLPATTLAKNCYNAMFYSSSSGVSTSYAILYVKLPAETLVESCYNSMFRNRGVANMYIGATDISARNCLSNWLTDPYKTPSGTIHCKSEMSQALQDSGMIPSGYIIQEDYA